MILPADPIISVSSQPRFMLQELRDFFSDSLCLKEAPSDGQGKARCIAKYLVAGRLNIENTVETALIGALE